MSVEVQRAAWRAEVGRAVAIDQWLDLIDREGVKYERHVGRVAAPPEGFRGLPRDHNRVSGNVGGELMDWSRASGDRCEVLLRPTAVHANAFDREVLPDVVVIDGIAETLDVDGGVVTNPTVIVEVHSDETQAYDRGEKLALYRSIESVREVLLVESKRVGVVRHRRTPFGWATTETRDRDGVVVLSSVGCELTVRSLYRRTGLVDTAS